MLVCRGYARSYSVSVCCSHIYLITGSDHSALIALRGHRSRARMSMRTLSYALRIARARISRMRICMRSVGALSMVRISHHARYTPTALSITVCMGWRAHTVIACARIR